LSVSVYCIDFRFDLLHDYALVTMVMIEYTMTKITYTLWTMIFIHNYVSLGNDDVNGSIAVTQTVFQF
jgi:hypothetical protein